MASQIYINGKSNLYANKFDYKTEYCKQSY